MPRTMPAILAAPLLVAGLAGCQSLAERPKKDIVTVPFPAAGTVREPAREAGWQLVWADEFDASDIDRTKWDFDIDCWGGGNNERQCYTDRPANAAVEGGKLVIPARKEQ